MLLNSKYIFVILFYLRTCLKFTLDCYENDFGN